MVVYFGDVVAATTDPDKKVMQQRMFEKLKANLASVEAAVASGDSKECHEMLLNVGFLSIRCSKYTFLFTIHVDYMSFLNSYTFHGLLTSGLILLKRSCCWARRMCCRTGWTPTRAAPSQTTRSSQTSPGNKCIKNRNVNK